MDGNNWRGGQVPMVQPQAGTVEQLALSSSGDAPPMDPDAWRSQFPHDSRQRIINKIMDTLKKHIPLSKQDGFQELKKIAVKFEEKIYFAATNQSDYLRRISLKMLTMETKSQTPMTANSLQTGAGSHSMQPQIHNNQGLAMPIVGGQSQGRQQLLSQNNISAASMQNSAVSSLTQGSIANGVGKNSNLQSNNSNVVAQNTTVGNSMGQGMPSNMFSNSQRQMLGRQQQVQQQPHLIYHQQIQQQLMKQKLQSGGITQSMLQSHVQKQQQQQQQQQQHHNLMQSSQIQSSQQVVMQNHHQSSGQQSTQQMLEQQSQPVPRQHQQQQTLHQQQTSMSQQPMLQTTQIKQQSLSDNGIQQNRLKSQQNNIANLQQQQQFISQQNNVPNMHQSQLGSGVSGLGMQSVASSGMPSNQHSVHMLQQKVPFQQQMQQNMSLMQNHSLQPQSQPSLQQIQPQSGQMQHLLMQRDMQLRLPTSGAMLQQQNLAEQQKQFFQSQRAMQEAPSSSLDSTAQTGNADAGDRQEEVYQKVKSMKDMYLLELSEMYVKIASRLQQHDALPQAKNEQLDKLKTFKALLDRIINFLKLGKNEISIEHKDKSVSVEKQIVSILNTNRHLKPASFQQTHENQMNPQSSTGILAQNNLSALHHSTLSSVPSITNSHHNMINSLQPSSTSELGPNNSSLLSPQQVAVNSILQNNSLTGPQSLNTLQTNPNMLQNQHLRQQEQLKRQMLHKQMQQQLLHNQQQQMKQHPGHAVLNQISDSSDVKMRQQMGVKQGVFQHHLSSNQRASQQVKPGSPFSIPSPQIFQTGSPQVPQQSSPQINQQNLATFTKTGTPLHFANSPFIIPSPSTPLAPSPMNAESEKVNTNIGQLQAPNVAVSTQSLAIGTPGISASPLLAEFTSLDGTHGNTSTAISGRSNTVERPIERLIKAVKSASRNALSASVSDISSVVSTIDKIAGPTPGNGSRGAVGEDLGATTDCRLQARNFFAQDGPSVIKKHKRFTTAMPSIVHSLAGSLNNSVWKDAFDLESTATSRLKRPKIEINHGLLDEIDDINGRLIHTLVDISDEKDVDLSAEGGKGTIVKCSFTAVALSPRLKSLYASAHMSPIQPLRMLIPINYPNCSPILLDNFPVEISKEYEDLSMKAKSRFSISLRSLSQPMSLTEMAKTWDNCARAVISEYAQQSGGGSFSSKYGTWENCISAS